jgi:rRNA maturation protein Rpf1
VKFGSEDSGTSRTLPNEFQLKRQVIELFEYVRAVHAGEIRCLEVRHGLPFSMEVEIFGAEAAAGGDFRA